MPRKLAEKRKIDTRVVGTITLTACKFKREASSDWELGWEVNESSGFLMDANGNIIKKVIYDIVKQPYYGFHILHRTESVVEAIETISEAAKV